MNSLLLAKPKSSNSYFLVLLLSVISLFVTACGNNNSTTDSTTPATMEELGRNLFFDTNLSNPPGQSCASCHTPGVGFDDPDELQATSEGANAGRFGSRNTQTASYSAFIPPLRFDVEQDRLVGGLFWDGRADSLEEQAQAPFLNPLEMNMASAEDVVNAVRNASYAPDFLRLFGDEAFDDVDDAYQNISEAIAAFERTDEFSPFSSKFDAVQAGDATFTESEQRGFALFVNELDEGGADCVGCHNSFEDGPVLFSSFEYENLGVPANPNNPFYFVDSEFNPDGQNFIDLGLGGVVGDVNQNGKFRTPILRNIAETGPYMHNGVFTTLAEVLQFYNNRDPNNAEFTQNITDDDAVGNLNMNAQQLLDLEAFLRTLSDGYSE